MGIHAASGSPVIVTLPAEIDTTNADQVYDQLHTALASCAAVVIADLTATTFCDSRGINRIIAARNHTVADSTQIRLAVSPGGTVARVLGLLGVDQLLTVYASVGDAADGLNAPADGPGTEPSGG